LTCVITLGGLLVVLAVSFYALVAPHLARLERQKLAEHCARIEAALQAEVTELDRFGYDWLAWDDTYAYVEQRDTSYAGKNVVPETFAGFDITILAILDMQRPIVYTGAYDRAARGGEDYGTKRRDIITRAAAALDVARVSFRRFTPDGAQIESEEVYDADSGAYSSGACVAAHEYPAYFHELAAHVIAANEARSDERTRETNERCLMLHGITSMMDGPVWLHGQLAGIVCCEQTGGPRVWTLRRRSLWWA